MDNPKIATCNWIFSFLFWELESIIKARLLSKPRNDKFMRSCLWNSYWGGLKNDEKFKKGGNLKTK